MSPIMRQQLQAGTVLMGHCRRVISGMAMLTILSLAMALPSNAQELLTNGDFETGTFAGWTITDLAGSFGTFFIDTPGTTTPFSSFPTLSSGANGAFYAVSDTGGPGTHALTQTFTVPGPVAAVILRFDLFANDQSGAGPIIHPIGLDHTASPNQHARVDILSAAAAPFDTGAGVLGNFYLSVDPGANPHPFTSYQFNITPLVVAGGTYQVRFAEVDNQFFFHLGVDNVSIQMTPLPPPALTSVPTVSQWGLMLLTLLLGVALIRFRRDS